jgi:hypothetical protein
MVLKGFERSDDEELPDEQDPGQSPYEDNEYPDIAMLEAVQPHVPAQPAVMPTFDLPTFDYTASCFFFSQLI